METYEDVLYEFSKEAYEHELGRKAHFTTWLGLYLTILSVLVGLIFKALSAFIVRLYESWFVVIFSGVAALTFCFAFISAFYFLKAFRFYKYKYLDCPGKYAKWMEEYIKKHNIDRKKHVDFLRKSQINGITKRLSEAIEHNRGLNDRRMRYLETCKNWALGGYVFLLIEYCFKLLIDVLGVFQNG